MCHFIETTLLEGENYDRALAWDREIGWTHEVRHFQKPSPLDSCVDWWVILSMQTVLFCIFGWQKTSYWCQLHQEIATNFLAANAIDAANKLALRSSETKVAGTAATPLFCSTVRSSNHLKIPKRFEVTFKNPRSLEVTNNLWVRVAQPSQKGHLLVYF